MNSPAPRLTFEALGAEERERLVALWHEQWNAEEFTRRSIEAPRGEIARGISTHALSRLGVSATAALCEWRATRLLRREARRRGGEIDWSDVWRARRELQEEWLRAG